MSRATTSIAKFTAMEVMHNRMLWLVAGAALVSIGIGFFGHSLAITESQQIQATFMSASLRVFAIFIVCLVVINTISRELNDKSLEMILSLAITRSSYFFGKLTGFNIVILSIVLIFALSLLLAAPMVKVFVWAVSLYCELFMVLCFSLLCVMTIRQVPLAICVVLGFYFLSRTINAAILMVDSPIVVTNSLSNSFVSTVLHGIAFVMPDLSNFTQSAWLIYGDIIWSDVGTILLQTAVYSILLMGACLVDFYRKSI